MFIHSCFNYSTLVLMLWINFYAFVTKFTFTSICSRSVRLGEYDTSNELGQKDCKRCSGGGFDCTTGAISIPIEKIIPHPNYDPYDTKTRRHDIALIRLSKSAPFSGKLITIILYITHNLFNVYISVWQAQISNWRMGCCLPFVRLNISKDLTCLRQITLL